MKVLIVGGTFDGKKGKPSKLIYQMRGFLRLRCDIIGFYNGGNYNDLKKVIMQM